MPSTHNSGRGPQRTNIGPAVEATKRYSAERAVDDPAKLERAARIVRIALERQRLTIDDLTPKSGK